MKRFKNLDTIISKCEQMVTDDIYRREDRAMVTSFYNGGAPRDEEELSDLGLTRNTNFLTGHRTMSDSKNALSEVYTKNKNMWLINLESAPPHLKHDVEVGATEKFNKIIKKSGRFKPQYEAASGEATMHGRGIFMFESDYGWCPKHIVESELLVPEDADTDIRLLPYGAIQTDLKVEFIQKQLNRIKERDDTGWNGKALKKLLDDQYDRGEFNLGSNASDDPEKLEEQRIQTSSLDTCFSNGIPVFYFFEVRHDLPGSPVDLQIVCRYNYTGDNSARRKEDNINLLLFKKDKFYKSMNNFIHAFHMDCTIGGRNKYHKVLGLGHLNYMLDVTTEELINRMHESIDESMRTMWVAGENADSEDLQDLIIGHNRIIPEGVTLLQNRFAPDPQGGFNYLNFLRGVAGQNANSHRQSGGGTSGQLQVQFMADQAQAQQSHAARMSSWYDYMDNLGKVVLSRFVDPEILPLDEGYAEIKEFQSFLKKKNWSLEWFNLDNISVHTNRIPGDGQRNRQLQEIMMLQQDAMQLDPTSRQKLLNRKFRLITGDEDVAEDLVPLGDVKDTSQIDVAANENVVMAMEGQPVQLDVKDNDLDHVPNHMQSMKNDLQLGQAQQGMDIKAMMGFEAKGAHIMLHLNRMSQMGLKDIANQWKQELMQISNHAEVFKKQLQEQQAQQQQPQIDPLKAAELQLKQQKFAQDAEKAQRKDYQFERLTANKEDMLEHTKAIQINQERRADAKALDESNKFIFESEGVGQSEQQLRNE